MVLHSFDGFNLILFEHRFGFILFILKHGKYITELQSYVFSEYQMKNIKYRISIFHIFILYIYTLHIYLTLINKKYNAALTCTLYRVSQKTREFSDELDIVFVMN